MRARSVASSRTATAGFSLIELLVVIVILGVLAAIAIPTYVNQRRHAEDAAAVSDVTVLGKHMTTWFVEHEDVPVVNASSTAYFLATTESTAAADRIETKSAGVVLGTSVIVSDVEWCVAVTNPRGATSKASGSTGGYRYSAGEGLGTGTC